MILFKKRSNYKTQNIHMKDDTGFDLKITPTNGSQILRGDLIFKNGAVWCCASKGANLFINLDNREQQQLKDEKFIKLQKLQLIPMAWQIKENCVFLEGRELGLGPTHKLAISWTKSFPELDLVAQQKAKGKELRHKVVLCQTTLKNTYLIVAVELL